MAWHIKSTLGYLEGVSKHGIPQLTTDVAVALRFRTREAAEKAIKHYDSMTAHNGHGRGESGINWSVVEGRG